MAANNLSFVIEIATYSLAVWLGLYVMGRDWGKARLRFAGLGLISYAALLGSNMLAVHAPRPELAQTLMRLHWPMLFLPAWFWFGATVDLLPAGTPLKERLGRVWDYGLWPLLIVFYLLSAGTNLIFDFSGERVETGPGYLIFSGIVLLPMGLALVLSGDAFRMAQEKKPLGLLLAATLFFSLSAGLLLLPLDWLPRIWLLLLISLDFEILGLAIAWLDAFEEGERLRPDFIRSLEASLLAMVLFGGPVALTIILGTGLTFPMIALLLAMLALAIASQVLADPLQAGLDALAFGAFPRLREARADLREAASRLPRMDETLDLEAIDEAEFVRLTRRALSHMGNLPRLAATPLIRLPLLEARLKARNAKPDTLERAAELKRLLAEAICQLKPRDKGDFGSSEEWRHYNALYFPYVVGLKPYSRRAEQDGLDPAAREALEWFRTYVPERTLYNWQNAAAEMVARSLREREQRTGGQGSRGVGE